MTGSGLIVFKAVEVTNAFKERDRLRRWLRKVASDHGLSVGELTFVLLPDKGLLPFNKRYLGHDEFTDVITFDLQTGTGVSGDILISYDRVKENAATFGVAVQAELQRVMVHGLLHLLGHSDKSVAKKKAMRALEDKYLAVLAKTK